MRAWQLFSRLSSRHHNLPRSSGVSVCRGSSSSEQSNHPAECSSHATAIPSRDPSSSHLRSIDPSSSHLRSIDPSSSHLRSIDPSSSHLRSIDPSHAPLNAASARRVCSTHTGAVWERRGDLGQMARRSVLSVARAAAIAMAATAATEARMVDSSINPILSLASCAASASSLPSSQRSSPFAPCASAASSAHHPVRSPAPPLHLPSARLRHSSPHSAASFYDMSVERYASQPLQPMTLREMLAQGEEAIRDPGFMIRSASYVHREMPVRLAKRLMDLQFLPHIIVINPHIKQVYDSYRRAFDTLTAFPEVLTAEDNNRFTHVLTELVDDHTPLLGILARGVRECAMRPLVGRELNMDAFLDNMLRSRISRRVIAEQHICLQRNRPGFIGVICSELRVRSVVDSAIHQTADVCRRTFGFCPEFTVAGDVDATFTYIPAHIEYILFEIFKNASRAVVEHHLARAQHHRRQLSAASLPPVTVTICTGDSEGTIKVSDQGGGIPREMQDKVWNYGFSSVDDMAVQQPAGPLDSHGSPMAGLGFGLPLSRLHAQYFGGDIEFFSIPGYGTDVYVRIHRMGDHAEEFEI